MHFCSDVPGVFPDSLRFPFIEGVPNAQKLADLKAWLTLHTDKYKNESVVLFHSTGARIPVLEQGLKPTTVTRRRSFQSQSGFCYLAVTPERAHAFGRLGNQNNARVYAVRILVKNLKADLDQLGNHRSVGTEIGNSLAESILWGGGARVKGAIPICDIAEVFEGRDRKFRSSPAEDLEGVLGRARDAMAFVNAKLPVSSPTAKL